MCVIKTLRPNSGSGKQGRPSVRLNCSHALFYKAFSNTKTGLSPGFKLHFLVPDSSLWERGQVPQVNCPGGPVLGFSPGVKS